MWYRGSVTVPADTAEADAVESVVEVSPGVITRFYRLFPPGCTGKVSLQVFWQTRQVFPTTPGQFYLGDGSEILGDASVDIDEPEYVLTLRAWAPGTTYQHIIYCEFYIEKVAAFGPVTFDSEFVPVPAFLENL